MDTETKCFLNSKFWLYTTKTTHSSDEPFIRYYNLNGLADGHFSQFLQDLKTVRKQGLKNFAADGNLEPAQALLFAFVKRLHEIAGEFNVKWRDYTYWYLQNKLGAQSLPVENHKICLHFTKSVNELVELKKTPSSTSLTAMTIRPFTVSTTIF
jgi:hypothetical protein